MKKSSLIDSLVQCDERSLRTVKPHVPTNNILMELAIGGQHNRQGLNACPGPPRGMVTNIYGDFSSGKTTLALHCAAGVIEQGGCALFVDFENALDLRYCQALGIPVTDPDLWGVLQPRTLEEGVSAIIAAADAGVDLIVLDSAGAAVPKSVFEQSLEEIEGGERGRLGAVAASWSFFLPKICGYLSNGNTALIGISQTRSGMQSKTVQGGNAWKFYAALRIELTRVFKNGNINNTVYNPALNKNENVSIGHKVKVQIRKSKVSMQQSRDYEVPLIRGIGFDPVLAASTVLENHNVVNKGGGGWYTWNRQNGEEFKVQGLGKFLEGIDALSGGREEMLAHARRLMSTGDGPDMFLPEGMVYQGPSMSAQEIESQVEAGSKQVLGQGVSEEAS